MKIFTQSPNADKMSLVNSLRRFEAAGATIVVTYGCRAAEVAKSELKDTPLLFADVYDPVALGIPTYHQVIREPMDLRTLARKMDAREVASPEEFARLARLVFENAMTFNIEPTHSVHQAARNLLILFNQKFRDVERMATTIQRAKGEDGKRKKDDKKRRRADDTRSLKRR